MSGPPVPGPQTRSMRVQRVLQKNSDEQQGEVVIHSYNRSGPNLHPEYFAVCLHRLEFLFSALIIDLTSLYQLVKILSKGANFVEQ